MAEGKTLETVVSIAGTLSPSLRQSIMAAIDNLDKIKAETLEAAGAAAELAAKMDTQGSVLQDLQRQYTNYVVSGEEGTEQAEELAQTIQKLSRELEENKDTLENAQKAAKRLADVQDDAGGATDGLRKKIASQQSELEALKAKYMDVSLEQGRGSKEAKELAGQISALSGELSDNQKELNAAEQAANRLDQAMEDAGKSAENSSEGYTVLKNVVANLATKVIDSAVEGFKELATEGDNAVAKLNAKIGASSGEMAKYSDVLYDVYNDNYGESLGDVSDALATVIQMTDDLDNASLEKITKNALTLEDVFEFDTTESLRAVNSLMDQFGITADEAFNLIVQGAQNGLNQNDDLLDTINEYSVQFRTAGYSANDMFNMLQNGSETGTWSIDKLGDAVKEFNIRMSDGTANEYLQQLGLNADTITAQFNAGGDEAQKAVSSVMQALQNTDDATKQYSIGVGLFGTMWEDLGADTVASLMNTQGAIDQTSAAMENMDAAAYDTLERSLSQLGRTVKSEVLQPIAHELTPAIKDAAQFVTANVGPAIQWLLKNLPTVAVVIGGISAALIAFKIDAFATKLSEEGLTIATYAQATAQKVLNAVMNANPIGLIILAITALVAAFVYLWNNSEAFRDFWIGLWDNITSAVSAAWDAITAVWSAVSGWFSDNVITPITSLFTTVWTTVSSLASNAWQTLTSGASAAWEGIKSVFSTVADFFGSIFSSAWERVKAVFSTGGKIFSGITEGIVSVFKNVVNTIIRGINKVVSIPFNAINGALNRLRKISIAGLSPFSWLPTINVPQIPLLASGGMTEGVSIAGEAGTEAVISFDPAFRDQNIKLWQRAGELLGVYQDKISGSASGTMTPQENYTATAGRLLDLDDFSLGDFSEGQTVIYYDFSGFTWSPRIDSGDSEKQDDFMARLKAHEAEFFDWLEEFVHIREVAQYA